MPSIDETKEDLETTTN
ncbi:99c597b4-8756-4725-b80d-5d60a36e4784 [Thermothielavioides terrestris]|uniref:99c597b4-8756-4725-b80d-5d60a36e4784 n=1 Tax=Thermothielavioides terrestris TaxID=2587410 RepID=A0A446BLI3_9PEZI|nr:99c597b4-8756-4725-b80d-5d60a36e4784 [Thermothielavioides terrestris]